MSLGKIFELGNNGTGWINIIVGFITSFFVGFFCIKYLLRYLKNHTLDIFAYYRFILAAGVLTYLLIN